MSNSTEKPLAREHLTMITSVSAGISAGDTSGAHRTVKPTVPGRCTTGEAGADVPEHPVKTALTVTAATPTRIHVTYCNRIRTPS
jgi:hypothetical protein